MDPMAAIGYGAIIEVVLALAFMSILSLLGLTWAAQHISNIIRNRHIWKKPVRILISEE